MRLTRRVSLTFFAAILATLTACASTESGKSTGEYIDDAAITAKVNSAFIRDDSLDAGDINVETYKGTVQLSGFVDSSEDIREAEELAREVDGVVRVRNDLRVKSEN